LVLFGASTEAPAAGPTVITAELEPVLGDAQRGVAALQRVDEPVGRDDRITLDRRAVVAPVSGVAGIQAQSVERGGDLQRAGRQAIAEIQARLAGAEPGQLSLAGGEAGALSLADGEPGRLTLTDEEPAPADLRNPERGSDLES